MALTLREQFALRAYQAALHVGLPLGIVLGLPLLLAKTKRRRTVFRRLGFQALPPTPAGSPRPVWVHALSLGETLSSVPLVHELRRRLGDRPLVFSVSTLSAHQVATQRLAPSVDRLFYFPFDLVPSIHHTLNRLRPALVLIVETDIWPGLLHTLRRRRIPAFLANARLSPSTFRSCQRFHSLFGPALNSFETLFPQSPGEADRYRQVGVDPCRLGLAGNLKFDTVDTGMTPDTRRQLLRQCGLHPEEPVWLAGSTHPGEEPLILEAFRELQHQHPRLRLIIVPRQPSRGPEIQALLNHQKVPCRRWEEPLPQSGQPVLVVDAMGLLAQLYHLAQIAFVGGSLVPHGGQNPLEPAAAGTPVLFGPHMHSFPDISAALLQAGAARQVRDAHDLVQQMNSLLNDAQLRTGMGSAGQALIAQNRGTTQRVADHVLHRLNPSPD